jgi:hypothetical protein
MHKIKGSCFSCFLLFLIAFLPAISVAKEDIEGLVYYDADETSVVGNTGIINLKGRVTILVGKSFIFADMATYDTKNAFVSAFGNVKVVKTKERLLAQKVNLNLQTSEMFLSDARIVVDPNQSEKEFDEKALGFSEAEILFEAERTKRMNEISIELRRIRSELLSQLNKWKLVNSEESFLSASPNAKELRKTYQAMLLKLKRVSLQENVYLASMNPETRSIIEKRRLAVSEFTKMNQSLISRLNTFEALPGYSYIKVKELYRKSDTNVELKNLSITSCNCDEDALPLWGFSGKHAEIEPEEYVTLKGAALEVLSTPVFYSPFLKVPIKTKRQSGFLIPSFYLSRAGNATSIPYFWAISDSVDLTTGITEFSPRGTRFENEFRFYLTKYGKIEAYSENISDNSQIVYKKDSILKMEEYHKKQKESDSTYPDYSSDNQRKANSIKSSRYYQNLGLVLPVKENFAFKFSGENVSDNRYLGDFDKDSGETSSFLSTPINSRRFLNQEASVEYFGNFAQIGLRYQNIKDLLATETSQTPVRLPKMELQTTPTQLGKTMIHWNSYFSWENIQRVGGSPFLDSTHNSLSIPGPGGELPVDRRKNERKDPDEPNLEGKRAAGSFELAWPLPQNPFFSGQLLASNHNIVYQFPEVFPEKKRNTMMNYNEFSMDLSFPLYSKETVDDSNSNESSVIKTDIVPSTRFIHIPKIYRDSEFPKSSNAFYEADNKTSKSSVELSLSSSFVIQRDQFEKNVAEGLNRAPGASVPVGDDTIYQKLLVELHNTSDNLTPFPFHAPPEIQETLFRTWADREIDLYLHRVGTENFGEIFHGTEGYLYQRKNKFTLNLITFSLGTEYFLNAKQIAKEKNERKNPLDARFPVEFWSNIKLNLGWNLNPLLPLSGSFFGEYKPIWERLQKGGYSLGVGLPWNLSLGYTDEFENTIVALIPERKYQEQNTKTTTVTYSPLNWLQMIYGKRLVIKENDRLTQGREYESVQKISFINLQDCLDLEFQRLKKAGALEREAIWSVGLNLRFLGYNRAFGNIGESLNRAIYRN